MLHTHSGPRTAGACLIALDGAFLPESVVAIFAARRSEQDDAGNQFIAYGTCARYEFLDRRPSNQP